MRLVGVDALLKLAEIAECGGLSHDDVISLLRPANPFADSLISLLAARTGAASAARFNARGPIESALD